MTESGSNRKKPSREDEAQRDEGRRAAARVRSGIAARHPGAAVLLAVVVSLAVHALIGYASYNQPLGYVDPAQLTVAHPPIRIKRAMVDQYVDPDQLGQGPGPKPPRPHRPSSAQLSQALLQQTAPPAAKAAIEPRPPRLKVDRAHPTQPEEELAANLEAFELPDKVRKQLAGRRPRELTYRDSTQAGFGAAEGQAHGGRGHSGGTAGGRAGGGGAGGEAGSKQASQLLAQAGFAPDKRGELPPLDQTPIDERPDLDQDSLEVPVQGPAIDFARVALKSTTQLKVPRHLDQDFDYRLTRYRRTGSARSREAGYFRVDITPRRSLHKLRTMPKDVVFLVDTSASVAQEWVRQATAGVAQSLWMLNKADRFNIVLFDQHPAFFSTGKPRRATHANIEGAVHFLTAARSRGYTDVNAALSRLLVRDVSTRRVYELVLISDGHPTRGVIDTRELINLITRNNDLTAGIYCVGIGRKPDHELLNFLAYRNKGFSVFADDKDHAAAAVRDLISRLRYPLIKNVHLSVAGRAVDQVYPVHLPDIHQGERFSLFGRYDQARPFTMRITGSSFGKNVDFTFERDLRRAPRGGKGIARGWAFRKLHHLYSEIIRRGKQPALLREIDRLREKYGLKTLY